MRILVVYNSALDGKSMSGVQRYFAGVVKHWIEQGCEVDFLVAKAAWPIFSTLFPRSRLISSDNVFDATKYLHQTWRFLPAFAWRMVTCHFTRLPHKYDLVLACAQFVYEVYPTKVLAKRCGAAFTVRIHHVLASQRAPQGVFDRMHFGSERLTAKWMNQEADAIICGTQLIARDYQSLEESLGLTPSKTWVTGYGADLDTVPLSVDSPKEFDAILLGRLHECKGIFDAPEIWKRVCEARPEAKLLVVGEGPHRKELQKRFEELNLSTRVVFTGGVSDTEKNALLARCRVGLSLSREEGWGLSVTEFLASGMPVVAMELPVFRDVFPGQLDFVPMGDTASTASRVLHWLGHPELLRERALAGRAFVGRYDNREVAKRELEIFEKAVERHRGRGQ
ncbi:MAG TPA: glycosyltransferase family 4 protein [Candidatus Limnocylindria bacterium]|nr:glycosyltransferase family 4 protein [Candidatus Limnocylindria bacterium]